MATYILTVRADCPKSMTSDISCFSKVVKASCVSLARQMAAEDAVDMRPYDNPTLWLGRRYSNCINADNEKINFGILSAEYV